MPIINRISKFIRCYANINGLRFKDSDLLFCTISNDEFVPGTIVMIYSMKKHLPKFHKYKIRIFFDNYISPLSVKNRQLLSSLGNNIELIEIEDEVYRNARCKHEKHRLAYLTVETFSQRDFSKIIFFDGDMLVLNDFTNALDFSFPIFGSKAGKFKSTKGPKFKWRAINTGLFGVDTLQIPNDTYNILKKIIMNRNDNNTELLDQKIINNYFSQLKCPQLLIHHFYNFRDYGASGNGSESFFKKHRSNIKILHFSGYELRPKPWEKDRISKMGLKNHAAYKLWRDYAYDLQKELPISKHLFL